MSRRSGRLLGWTLAVLVATFVSGFAVGRVVGGAGVMPPGDPESIAGVIDQLELDSTRRVVIDEILRRRGDQTDSIMRNVFAGLRDVVNSTTIDIRGVLSDAERAAFDSLIAIERGRVRLRQPMPSAPRSRTPTPRR